MMKSRMIAWLLAVILTVGAVPGAYGRAEELPRETAAEAGDVSADTQEKKETEDLLPSKEGILPEESELYAEERAAEMIYEGELRDGLVREEKPSAEPDSYSTEYPNTWVNTGDQARDIVEIALTQVGYKENSDHTKYNAWYYGSDIAAAWCNIFVSWCANQAGIPTSIVPKMAATRYTKAWMVENAFYDDTFQTTPRCGDLIFFHNDSGTICHIAMVISYDASENTILYVGGNQSNGVTVRTLAWVKNQDWYGIKLDGYARPNYTVTQQETVRVAGNTRYDTSLKTADLLQEALGGAMFSNVILTTGENYADALSGSYLAAKKKAPILLTNASQASKVNSYIKSHLKSGGTIYVLGSTQAVPESLLSGLSDYKILRLAGGTRYSTNLAILEEAGISYESEVYVITGNNYAEGLSASSSGKPVFLVAEDLTKAQKTTLQGMINLGCTFKILGGESAVSVDIEQQIRALGGQVSRIYGATRYATSALVAGDCYTSAARVILVYGENFPDGSSPASNIRLPRICRVSPLNFWLRPWFRPSDS